MMFDANGQPISSVDQVMRQAKSARLPMPFMLGGDMPTEDVGEVGSPPPVAPSAPPARLPMPGPVNTPAPAPAPSGDAGKALAPPVASQPEAAPPRDDGRNMLRETAQALIALGTPAQRVQGMQMMFEANQPTPAEKDAKERARLSGAVDTADVKPEVKARAKLGVEIGAKPEQLLEVLGFDPKGQAAQLAQKEKLTRLLSEQARTQFTNATLRKSAERAINYIDKAPATTGTTGYLASWVPGSSANKLENALSTIKANLGFDRLDQMREESKTGGALGGISNTELHFLQASQGSLDITNDPEVLKQNIQDVIKGKELLTELRGLMPGIEGGDKASIDRYMAISAELGTIGETIKDRGGNWEVPKAEGKGADIDKKYGLK